MGLTPTRSPKPAAGRRSSRCRAVTSLVLGSPDRLARHDGAAILRTTNGGATWQMAATGLSAVEAFQFVDVWNGWAWHAGSLGLVHTTDGGATWRPQSTGSDAL